MKVVCRSVGPVLVTWLIGYLVKKQKQKQPTKQTNIWLKQERKGLL